MQSIQESLKSTADALAVELGAKEKKEMAYRDELDKMLEGLKPLWE